jgi:hypothetical protein
MKGEGKLDDESSAQVVTSVTRLCSSRVPSFKRLQRAAPIDQDLERPHLVVDAQEN